MLIEGSYRKQELVGLSTLFLLYHREEHNEKCNTEKIEKR